MSKDTVNSKYRKEKVVSTWGNLRKQWLNNITLSSIKLRLDVRATRSESARGSNFQFWADWIAL